MDVSKLPKLSQTTPPADRSTVPAEPAPAAVPALPYSTQPRAMAYAEAWISIGVGLFLWLFQPRMLQWLSSRLFHTHFDEFVRDDGTIVSYLSQPAFWMDLGPTLFGLVLILDGLIIAFIRRPAFIWAALLLTALTTAYNLIYLVISYSQSGFAPISFLAVLFGGYMVVVQWQMVRPGPLRSSQR